MRRIRLVVVVGVVMAAMLALSAGPAIADEFDGFLDGDFDHNGVVDGFDEVIWIPEGTAAFDELCSPGLREGVFIPGCIFSDVEEDEDFDFVDIDDDDFLDDVDFLDDADIVFVVDDDIFDDDNDNDRDGHRHHRDR